MPEDLTDLEEEVRKDPRKGRFYELAREYQRLGRLDDAALVCEEGLSVNATRWQARILLAQICVARGDFKEAEIQVTKVLMALPDNVPANHLAADIFFARGDKDKALKHYKIVQLFEPGLQQVEERVAGLESGLTPQAAEPAASAASPEDRGDTAPETVAVETASLIQQEQPKEVEENEEAVASTAAIDEAAEIMDTESSWEVPDEDVEDGSDTEENDIFGEEQEGENLEAVLTEETDENWEDTRESGILQEEEQHEDIIGEKEEQADLFESAREEANDQNDHPLSASFGTNTLAEMYEEQGYPEKAIEVYQRLLLKDPNNRQVLDEIEQLKRKVLGEAAENPAVENTDIKRAIRQKRINLLEAWLHNLRGRADV